MYPSIMDERDFDLTKQGWTKIEIPQDRMLEAVILPKGITGEVSEHMDYILFENPQDAVLYRLSIQR